MSFFATFPEETKKCLEVSEELIALRDSYGVEFNPDDLKVKFTKYLLLHFKKF